MFLLLLQVSNPVSFPTVSHVSALSHKHRTKLAELRCSCSKHQLIVSRVRDSKRDCSLDDDDLSMMAFGDSDKSQENRHVPAHQQRDGIMHAQSDASRHCQQRESTSSGCGALAPAISDEVPEGGDYRAGWTSKGPRQRQK